MEPTITLEDPATSDVVALLTRHLGFARAMSPPEHVHALDLEGLRRPEVSFYCARRGGRLLGVGALKQLDEGHVEIKSMHTLVEERGHGIGGAILGHLLGVARARGCHRVSLETGSTDAFAPARRLYKRFGFAPCEPFGAYTCNGFSVCMTLRLDDADRA